MGKGNNSQKKEAKKPKKGAKAAPVKGGARIAPVPSSPASAAKRDRGSHPRR